MRQAKIICYFYIWEVLWNECSYLLAGQFALSFVHKIMIKVGLYFKQEIQSNILLVPNRYDAILASLYS